MSNICNYRTSVCIVVFEQVLIAALLSLQYSSRQIPIQDFSKLNSEKDKIIRYGTKTVTYKAAWLWELLLYGIKNSAALIEFKDRIKT